jgi:hypothetical protein
LTLDHSKGDDKEGDLQKLAEKWTLGIHEATAANDEPSQILKWESPW